MAGHELSLSTSISLIERARALEPDAWHMLTRLYGPLIYGWARRNGLQSQDAADVLQNVFVSVWKGMKSFSMDRPDASFRGWLRIITQNAVREWGRRRNATLIVSNALAVDLAATSDSSASLLPEDAANRTWDDLFGNLTHQALNVVRSTVDARTWDAFWKTTIDEMSPADVASSLQMSVAAVRQAKYRVLCRLREMLADR